MGNFEKISERIGREEILENKHTIMQKLMKRRLEFIPIWMKIFMWIFVFLGTWIVFANILRVVGINFAANSSTSIYGLETFDKNTLLYFFISGLIVYKTIVSFAMITEKKWAISAAIIDAILGLLVVVWVMVLNPLLNETNFSYDWNFQFELLLLIPYLLKCIRIKKDWENFEPKAFSPEFIIENIQQKMPLVKVDESETPTIQEEVIVPEPEIIIDREDPSRFMPK